MIVAEFVAAFVLTLGGIAMDGPQFDDETCDGDTIDQVDDEEPP